MFDLHSHILPGLDDGAQDLPTALDMAKAYVDQGVTCVACTPHILPGLYQNDGSAIRRAVAELSDRISEAGLSLVLTPGADNHMTADFVDGLRAGRLLTLADSTYVLVEPPHHIAPARLPEFFFDIQVAGYTPILTHPERLTWVEDKYPMIQQLASKGVWMQLTSGSLRGTFGRRPRYWAERMLAEGLVHFIASDAHNMKRRAPDLADGFRLAKELVGADEAENLFVTRPRGIVFGVLPSELPALPGRSLDANTRNYEEYDASPRSGASDGRRGGLWRLFAKQ